MAKFSGHDVLLWFPFIPMADVQNVLQHSVVELEACHKIFHVIELLVSKCSSGLIYISSLLVIALIMDLLYWSSSHVWETMTISIKYYRMS